MALRRGRDQTRPMGTLTGCILDFDGVIVDSEPAHAAAKRLVLERRGTAFEPGLFDAWKGRTDPDFFAHVVQELAPGADPAALLTAKRAAYEEVVDLVTPVDGIEGFLAAARTAFAKLGVATSASPHDVGLVERRLHLLEGMDTVVTAADTVRHKPDPEPYLVALDRLGLRAEEAIAVEDSPNGIRSARAAGLEVIGLVGAFDPRTLLEAGASRTTPGLRLLADEVAVAVAVGLTSRTGGA
jgi:HAD superfamily hydrolase (TIGR01509 family)